ncbi:hypothetical protein PVAND_011246 [Polypedilum vanderplanki]|uniref:Major facilitator superfamily (MFS) profile domain-containing protein n=1 Tax=Polypedilum vanderplanki TaxID=319348 RepID=A0A9J6CJT5_POLVA|nr:hypothetical protein PVAND_011246 [Polypedilum vanderplanki]
MWSLVRTTIVANIGSFFFGVSLVWSSIIGVQIVENEKYKFWITKTQFGIVVSALSFGAACSCIISGVVRHSFGTRFTIFIFSSFATIGSILITVPQNLLMLIVGRFLLGLAIGSYSFVIPIYIGEISSSELRGIMLSYFQIMLNLGILLAYILGYFVNVNNFNIVCGSIPLFYSIAFLALPESPVFLVSKGKYDKTHLTMQLLRGREQNFQPEIASMKEEQTKIEKTSFSELMKVKCVKKALIIIMFQFFCFQLSGANAVTFYAQQIFNDAAMNIESSIAAIIVTTFQFITSVIAVRYINLYGRKKMICTFNLFLVLSLMSLGIYFILKDNNYFLIRSLSWLPLLSMCVYLVTFCLGMGPVTYIWLGELFIQNNAKKTIAPLGQMINHTLTFLIGLFFPLLTNLIGSGFIFFSFAVVTVIDIIFIILFVPETNGKTSEEIQNALSR